MKLEQSLILNRYFHSLFGARGLEDLKPSLSRIEEGPRGDDQSQFYHALAGLKGRQQKKLEKLPEYDARVVGYEARLAKARGSFAFKYFQYLCLLYTEIFLDRLTEDLGEFLLDLNAFLEKLKGEDASLREFPAFTPEDLRRLAFFMATGSGKTLLLHANLWQVLHYLERGRHPEALVQRADRRRAFDSILLITPNEGLSQQHLDEFTRSGIDAVPLVQERVGQRTLAPQVKVIEIHKLAEEPSKEGVSVLLEELGGANLVFVDEGHKGTGSEAQTWKTRQRRLSAEGFLLEYSATFAQSIGAAGAKAQKALLAEYGKTILFDYSYRHFYDDGYGKDFRVLNLARAREAQAHELLLGGLLTYYQQLWLFRKNQPEYRAYNLERPLWVFLGSRVSKRKGSERDTTRTAEQERSDVAKIVAFLKRFLEDPSWAAKGIRQLLKGESGFTDQETREDLFAPHLAHLKGRNADGLYRQIATEVFHGRGGLEIYELKGAEGELGLRVSAPEGQENPYFGVINIGDVSSFKKHLAESLGIEVREDRFTASLFGEINAPDSRVNVLIGAKKFIEGWSSWRVSTMGLLNIGKGEGPQVIQLFGRGVRLKGKEWTLKRSAKLPGDGPHPAGLADLETLFIFGWNADYIQTFRRMLEQEDLGWEITMPVTILYESWSRLPIPVLKAGYRAESETWSLLGGLLEIPVDLSPRVTAIAGTKIGTGKVATQKVSFADPGTAGLLDIDALYASLLEYKTARRYGNVYVPRDQILPILRESTLLMAEHDQGDPRLLQEGALRVLKTYLDRFVSRKAREAESRHLAPGSLSAFRDNVLPYYTLRVTSAELLKEIKVLLRKPKELCRDEEGRPLPRLHVESHLFTPILLNPKAYGLDEVSVSPSGLRDGEAEFLKDLRAFWKEKCTAKPYRHVEIVLLRNLPRVGVGFFRRSNFYPDFVLWIRDKQKKTTRILFIEPHGMRLSGGLAGNKDKIEAMKELEKLSREPGFRKRKITMAGYLLTQTELKDILDAEGKNWGTLEKDYRVLHQSGAYIKKILSVE